jgi:hypothetical protein
MEQQKTFNFNLPSPYQTEMAELARRQRMAETLQQQSAEPVQKFGYGGIEVPVSPLTGLAKALNSFTAKQIEKDVLQKEKALGEKYRADQMGDVNRLVSMLKARSETPADVMPNEILGGGPVRPAVQAKAENVIDPSEISQLRTPEMQNLALQQYFSQSATKTPVSVAAGASLVNPVTGKAIFTAPREAEYSTTPTYVKKDGKTFAMYASKHGGQPLMQEVQGELLPDANTQARLAWDKFIHQNPSAYQNAQLGLERGNYGIRAGEYTFNTGMQAPGVPGVKPIVLPYAGAPAAPLAPSTAAPAAAPAVAPAAALPTPARAPALVQPPAAAAPTQMPTPASMAGMTPKTQQEVLKDQFKAQYASLPEAANKQIVGARNLTQAIDEYQNALKDWSNLKMYNPNARAEMGRVYNNMMLQAKEAYNLGVLNGPDYNILTSVVADPTKPMSAFLTNDTLKKQSKGLRQTAINIEKTAREVHNRSAQGQTRVPRYNPATGRIE